MMKSKLLLLSLLSLLLLPLFAQEKEEPPTISKQVSFLLWSEVKPSLWLLSEDKLIPLLDLSTYRRSTPIDYKGPPVLKLFAGPVINAKDTAPKEIAVTEELTGYTLVASILIRDDILQPLVMLVPGTDPLSGIQSSVMEDDPREFPYGTFRFFNMSPNPLLGELDENRFQLNPLQMTPIDPKKGKNGTLNFVLAFRDGNGEWAIAQKTVFRYRIRRRELIFIKPSSERPNSFETLSVVEYDQPEIEKPNE